MLLRRRPTLILPERKAPIRRPCFVPFPDQKRRIIQPTSIAYASTSSGQGTTGSGLAAGPFSITGLTAIPSGAAVCVAFCTALGQSYSFPLMTVTAGSNTATAVSGGGTTQGGSFFMETYYFLNVTGGPTSITFTRISGTQTFDFISMQADCFTGVATSAALDGHNMFMQGSSTIVTGSSDVTSTATAPGTGTNAVTTGAGYTQSTTGDLMWVATVDTTGTGGITVGTNFTQGLYQGSINMTEYNLNQSSGTVIGTFTTTDGTAQFITAAMSLKSGVAVASPNSFGSPIFRVQQPLWR